MFKSDVLAIAIDPDSSNIVYLVVDNGVSGKTGLMQTTDGGATWELWDLGVVEEAFFEHFFIYANF